MKRFWYCLRTDFCRLWRSAAWIPGIVGVAFALYFALEGGGFLNNSVVFSYTFVTNMSGMLLTYVFCALPFAAVFSEDIENKYFQYEVIRGNLKTYVAAKILVIYLSSVLVMLCGTLIFLLFARTQVPWDEAVENSLTLEKAGCYGSLLESGHYLAYCMLCALHLGMLAGFLSVCAAFCSVFISNRMLVFILPVLFWQMMIYFKSDLVYTFYATTKKFQYDWQNLIFVLGVSLLLSGALAFGILKGLKRRL